MKSLKRIGAIIAPILWAVLLIMTLVTAISTNETLHSWFFGLLFTDIVLPVVLYAMILAYRVLHRES